ncbi:MAG TPA: hypothetical protein VGM94_06670 [Galbitalea sp.]|jgi:hypothetical protein
MTQVLVADLLTGRRILNVPFSGLSWTKERNKPDVVSCTIPMASRALRKLDLPNATTPAKSLLAVIENDTVMALGEIWSRSFDDPTKKLSLSASGVQGAHFQHRAVLPPLTDDQNVIDPTTGASAAVANTDLVGMTYGLMVKRLVQQMMSWPGGTLPIVFQDDEIGGAYEQHYLGANLTKMDAAVASFIGRENGIDIDFLGRRTSDRRGVEILLRTGTLAEPELHGISEHRWDLSVPRPSIRNLQVADDATNMTGQAWTTGGRQDGTAVVSRAMNTALTDVGYPLMESVDSSHPDVSDPATLLAYSQDAIADGAAPGNTWSFEARADRNPRVGAYWPGDFVNVIVPRDHPWIPKAGVHRREIRSTSGDQDGKWIKVILDETTNA